VLDVLVPKVVLQGPRVVAIVGQLEPAGMAQHVGVDRKWHLGGLTDALDEAVEANRADLRANPIAVLLENVGDLLSNSGHRAPTAQEEVVSLTRTDWHECWCPRSRAGASLRALSGPERRVVCDEARSPDGARGGCAADQFPRLLLGNGEWRILAGAGVAEPPFPGVGVVGPLLQLDAPQRRLGGKEELLALRRGQVAGNRCFSM